MDGCWMDGCWMDGCWMDVGWLDGWMVGESGIKSNSAQFSWSLAELGKNNINNNNSNITTKQTNLKTIGL